MPLRLACVLAPGPQTVEHARLAEALGYDRVWLADSPPLWQDIWARMALVAEQTHRVQLGTAVLIPSLRHVVTQAAAIATIADIAPGRLTVGLATGFTGRAALGQHTRLRWAVVKRYVQQLRGLLHGEQVEVDGALCQLIPSAGFMPPQPITMPIVLAASGPRGYQVAREVADGIPRRREAQRVGQGVEYSHGAGECRSGWVATPVSNMAVEPAPNRVRSSVASAMGCGSPWAFGDIKVMMTSGDNGQDVDRHPGFTVRLDGFAVTGVNTSRGQVIHSWGILGVVLIVGIACVMPAPGDDRRSGPGVHGRWWQGEWKEEFWDGPFEVKIESKRGQFTREIKCKDGVGARWREEGKHEFRDGSCTVKVDAKRDEYKEEVTCDR